MTPAQATIRQWRHDPVKFVTELFEVAPDTWQLDALASVAGSEPNPRRRLAMKACTGPGKQIADHEMVPTPIGFRRHGDLKPGDEVFAEDGSIACIVASIRWREQPAYRVTFTDGTAIECAGPHLWKVRSRFHRRLKTWNTIETQEMHRIGPRFEYPDRAPIRRFMLPTSGPVQYPEKQLPLDPYVLGVWLGDGCRKSSYIIKDDQFVAEEIRRRGYDVFAAKKFDNAGQRYWVRGLRPALKTLGIAEAYSGQRFVPAPYLEGSVGQRKALLAGLLDTDGRCKTNNSVTFTSTSLALATDVITLVRSLGGIAHLQPYVDHRKETSTCYSVRVLCPFNPFYLPRKGDRWRPPQEHRLHRFVDTIEPIGTMTSQCIEIDHPSHVYLVGESFIPTHNSAVLAWLAWHRLVCFADKGEHPKGAALSGEGRDNLRDNLWAEIGKWQDRSPFLKTAFEWTKERVYARGHEKTWFCSARSYAKDANAEAIGSALSGLHSRFPFLLLDEIGMMPPTVGQKASQIFTGGVEDGLIAAAGNPTSTSGLLYDIWNRQRGLWTTVTITADPDDPKRTPRVDPVHAREQIAQYGRDNPWVMATILGLFPPTSLNALLGIEDVERAMNRHLREDVYEFAQKRLGVDCARFGDDATIIFPRQGLAAFKFAEMRNARSNEIAARVAKAKMDWESELEFVDGTGGWGSGVIDSLTVAGHTPFEVQFAGRADDPRFYNKRTEMWWRMAEWVKKGGALPRDPQLQRELTEPLYYYQDGKIRLEEKDQIKKRLGFSPDRADSLGLTFAIEEQSSMRSPHSSPTASRKNYKADYDPFESDGVGRAIRD